MAKKKTKVTASSILNEANRQSAARDKVDARQILNRATAQAGEPVRDRAAERERERRKQDTLAYLDQLRQKREQQLAPWRAVDRMTQAKKEGLYTSPFSEASKARMAGTAKARTYTPGVANGVPGSREEIRAILDRESYKAATAPVAQRSAGENRKTVTQSGANQNTGWRRIGNRFAFVTENNPLPAKSFESPKDYVDTMRAVDEYNAWKAAAPAGRQRVGSLDTASQAFLQKWMGSRAEDATPTTDDVLKRYKELGENPAQQELFWTEWNQNAALNEAVNRDEAAEREAYRRAGEGKKAAYETALRRLPAGMAGMATGNTADYYTHLSKTADGKREDASARNHPYAEYANKAGLVKGWGDKSFSPYTDSRYDYLDYSMYVPKWADQRRARRWAVSTDEERKIYDMLEKVYGEEAARGYEDSMQEEWDRRVTEYETGVAERVADAMPITSSARDVFAAPVKGLGYMERLGRQMLGQEVGAHDQATLLSRITDASRGQVSQKVRDKGGDVLGFVYDSTMSIFDNLMNQAVWGGLGEAATLVSMGASSAGSAYNDAIDRGADVNQAMAAGTLAGLAEAVFEKVPLERFLDLVKGKSSGKFMMELLRQSGIEATEEMCTELANTLTDSLVMGEKSNYALGVEAYISSGMSQDEARRAAMLDVCKNIGMAGLGGGFSGMVMGGVGQGIGKINARETTDGDKAGRANRAIERMPDMMNAEGIEVEYTPAGKTEGEGKSGTRNINQKGELGTAMPETTTEDEHTPAGQTWDADNNTENARAEAEREESGKAPLTRREGVAVNEGSGEGEAVTVTGVREVKNGHVYFDVETADGEASVMSDMDVDLADADSMELLATGTAGRMDARGAAAYLDGYDAGMATVQQYANAFAGVYTRAKTGLTYDMAADSEAARRYLTPDAMREAYMAGLAAYNEQAGVNEGNRKDEASIERDGRQSESDNVRFSIREEDGQRFVEVDTDQDIFEGLSGNEALKKARDYILSHFRNQYIGQGAERAHISRATADEYAHSAARKNMHTDVQNAKARVSTELDNLLSIAEYTHHKDDDGRHKEAVHGWDYYDVQFRINGRVFEGQAVILKGDTYQRLYDVTKIKEAFQRIRGLSEINQNAPSAEASGVRQSRSGLLIGSSGSESTGDAISISKTETKSKKKPGVTRKYSANAFAKLSGEQKRASIAQIELLDVLAKRTGRMIDIVDTIDGGRANAKYDPKTGRITIALDATEGAYLYAGMHELTHAIKAEHTGEWQGFADYVTRALERNGQDMEALVKYQMERFGYSREQALEEVICNTAPAVLQDESNLQSLLRTDRKLYERVLEWISGLIKDIRQAGQRLSQRGKSWEQMDALRSDREALQGIYERMIGILEGEGENSGKNVDIRVYSQKEAQAAYAGTNLAENGEVYTYDFLTRLPDMQPVVMGRMEDIRKENKISEKAVLDIALENGLKNGEKLDEKIIVQNKYTGRKLRMTAKAIRHSLGRENFNAAAANARAAMKTGELIANAIPLNALYNTSEAAQGTYAMAAYMVDEKETAGHVAVLTVEQRSGDVLKMEVYDTLHALSTRKRNVVVPKNQTASTADGQRLTSPTRSFTISIADFLAIVKETHQSLLSEDVLAHFGEERNPKGYYNGRAKFSLRDTDENVQTGLEALDEARRLAQGHTITALEAEKLARHMKKLTNSSMDTTELAKEISRSYAYMERGEGVDMRQVDEEQVDLMARLLEGSQVKDMEHEERAKPVRDYLRKTAIRLTESQRAETEKMTGSYNAYHKALFGNVRLNQKNGAALDSVWGDLNSLDAEWFPADANEGDMARLLLEAADAAKPVYNTGLGMNAEEAAQYFAGEMNKAYLNLPGVLESARDIKMFGGSVEAYRDAQKRFKETSMAEYERALASIKEAREDSQRTQQQLRRAALRKKYQAWRTEDTLERKERELVNRYRPRIERTAGALLKWYESPTDMKHIPEDLREQVDGIVTALDFTGKSTRNAVSLSERIAALAGALDKASGEESAAEGFAIERDQMWLDELNRLARIIPKYKAVYELNGAELKELSKWMDSVKHVLVEANKMHGTNLGSVEETAAASMAEMSQKKAYWQKSQVGRYLNDTFGIEMLDSFSYFKRLGPTAERVFEGVRKGFDKNVENVRQARAYCEKLLEGVDVKALAGKRAKKTAYELESGEKLELTRAQVMELYCLNGREQARGHLYGNGVRLYEDANVRPHKLTRADVEGIVKTLTDEEKRIADGLQSFMAKECAAWGNEVSMKLFAYKKFGEKTYYPIRVDNNETNTTRLDPASDMASIAAIRNQGMTKSLTEGANNAIMLGSVFDTFTRHVSQMNAYNAYAVPLYDMQRWLNTKGVKTEIEQLYGSAGKEYVLNFMKAVNGTVERSKSRITKPLDSLVRNAKTAAVGGNLQVAIQQPTSYARAANMISGKYLSKAALTRKTHPELVDKYCAIAQWKKWGFYETDVGPNLRGMLLNEESLAESLKDKGLWLAGKGDEWTLNHLWIACELETRDLHPELEAGTEAYYRHVGERMSGIVDRTQVVDSVFHRSQAMRRKDTYTQLATSFMAEPIKNYNMVMEAVAEYAEARRNGKNSAAAKLAGRKVGRALTVYAINGLLTAMAKSLTSAMLNGEDKDYWEKYLEELGGNAVDSLNPFANIPVVGDTLDMVMRGGQAGSSLDNQSIQKIVWAAQEIGKYMSGKSELNWYGVGYKMAQALSSVTGIPAGNILRDVNAAWQTATGKSLTLSETGSKRIAQDNLFKATKEGDKETQTRLRKKMREQLGMSDKEIDAAIGKKLAEDERIAAGWKAKQEMRVGDVNRLKNELAKEGYTGEMVDKAIQRYGDTHDVKEEKEKEMDEQLKVKLYTTEDGADAVRGLADGSVSLEDARLMISEMAAESDAKEPEKSVRSGIQSEIKKDYLAALGRGDTKRMDSLEQALASLFDTPESGEKKDGVETTVKGWRKEVWNAELETAVDGGNQDGARKAVAKMRKDGWTDESIAATLRSRYKELYLEGGVATRDRISRMLCGLGLKTEKGNEYFTPDKIGEWKKKK